MDKYVLLALKIGVPVLILAWVSQTVALITGIHWMIVLARVLYSAVIGVILANVLLWFPNNHNKKS